MAAPSRLAAALDYLERLKSQADQYGNQTQMQTANVGKEFLSGVGQNLAERAKGLGQIGYEAFSQPTQPYATTAEISAQPRNTPIIDETTMALGVPRWWYSIWLPALSLAITLRAMGLALRLRRRA